MAYPTASVKGWRQAIARLLRVFTPLWRKWNRGSKRVAGTAVASGDATAISTANGTHTGSVASRGPKFCHGARFPAFLDLRCMAENDYPPIRNWFAWKTLRTLIVTSTWMRTSSVFLSFLPRSLPDLTEKSDMCLSSSIRQYKGLAQGRAPCLACSGFGMVSPSKKHFNLLSISPPRSNSLPGSSCRKNRMSKAQAK